jgi:hypothetical protein
VEELYNIRISFGRLWVTAFTAVDQGLATPLCCSDDGVSFTQANQDGFGDANNLSPNPVTVGFGDYQYHDGPNTVSGGQIWRLRMR